MAFRIERRPFKIGSSLAITLPPAWCSYYRDRLTPITMLGNTILILAPKGLEAQAQKLIEEVETMNEK